MKPHRKNGHFLVIIFFSISILLLILVHTRGFIPHDEGWIINPAYRFLSGEIPYRDFHFIYFPGSLFLTASILSIWKSILALRIFAIFVSLLGTFFMYKISLHISKNRALSLLSSLVYLTFGPFSINFLAPAILALPVSYLAVYLLFAKHPRTLWILVAGIMTALAILFKQNFGGALLLSCLLGIIWVVPKNVGKTVQAYILGVLLGLLPTILFLAAIDGLLPFLSDTYYFTVEKAMSMGMQNTPFIYPAPLYYQIPKTIFYLLPGILSAVALFLSLRYEKKLAPFPLFTLFIYIGCIRPTTDYIHLIPLMASTGIPLVLLLNFTKQKIIRFLPIGLTVSLIILATYIILFKHYYRWEDPLLKHTTFSPHPRVNIWVDTKSFESISEIEKIVEENNLTNTYFFIYDFAPMYYFVTNTKNPTRFDYFPPLSKDDTTEIINDITHKKVPAILTLTNIAKDTSPIGTFIQSHYRMKKYRYFFLWTKKSNS